MTTLRAHFDGRVIVPEGPVDLPQGESLEIDVRVVGELRDVGIRLNKVSGFPEFDLPEDSPVLSLEAIQRALDEE